VTWGLIPYVCTFWSPITRPVATSGSMGQSKLVNLFKFLITTHKYLFYKMQIFNISFFDLTMNSAVKNFRFCYVHV
jgi:hypothetical protein